MFFVLDELSFIYKIKMTYVSIQPILCIVSKDYVNGKAKPPTLVTPATLLTN